MKKLARFLLVWIIVSILGGVGGYFWLDYKIMPVYSSTTQIYVIPGVTSEASLRATDGGLKNDFEIVFKSKEVISEAKRTCQTTEDIASYISIRTPENSNVIEIICSNPDQSTAKKYADAVAKSGIKYNDTIPIERMSILTEGTTTEAPYKPNLYKYSMYLAGAISLACFLLEMFITLLILSFAKDKEEDDEADYNRNYGNISNFNNINRETYPDSGIQIAKKEAAATVSQNYNNNKEQHIENEDDKDLIDESDIMDIEDLTDIEFEEDKTSVNIKSSSDVIGRIPR